MDDDVEGTARDVLVAPLDHQDVVPWFMDDVVDAVRVLADVLDPHLFARHVGAQNPDHQHVVACQSIESIDCIYCNLSIN